MNPDAGFNMMHGRPPCEAEINAIMNKYFADLVYDMSPEMSVIMHQAMENTDYKNPDEPAIYKAYNLGHALLRCGTGHGNDETFGWHDEDRLILRYSRLKDLWWHLLRIKDEALRKRDGFNEYCAALLSQEVKYVCMPFGGQMRHFATLWDVDEEVYADRLGEFAGDKFSLILELN